MYVHISIHRLICNERRRKEGGRELTYIDIYLFANHRIGLLVTRLIYIDLKYPCTSIDI